MYGIGKGRFTGGQSPPELHSPHRGQKQTIKHFILMTEEKKTRKEMSPVFIVSKDFVPLMPTRRYGWVRRGLRAGKMKVIMLDPFVVQLCYETETMVTQDLRVGIDIGHTHIAISVSSETRELFVMQIDLRTDIKESLRERAGYRHSRRYRGPSRPKKKHFGKPVGWLAPSNIYVATIHENIVKFMMKFLPITDVIVEKCKFDFQLMFDPNIIGTGYQQGPLLGYDNTRQYIIARDHNECQICHGKSRDKHLEVHHIIFQSKGGTNIPSNLITLCSTCHKKLHAEQVKLDIDETAMPQLRPAATVNIVSNEIVRRIKALGMNVHTTFGYITNYNRKQLGLEKSHVNDAFVIAGNTKAKRLDMYFKGFSFKRHYRKLHEAQPRRNMFYWHKRKDGTLKKIDKKGKQKNKTRGLLPDGSFIPPVRRSVGKAYRILGFGARDTVKYNGRVYFISARRTSGCFELTDKKTGKRLPGTVNAKKLTLLYRGKPLMITEICERI